MTSDAIGYTYGSTGVESPMASESSVEAHIYGSTGVELFIPDHDAAGYTYENVGMDIPSPYLWRIESSPTRTGSNAIIYGIGFKARPDSDGILTKVFWGTQSGWDGSDPIIEEKKLVSELPETFAATESNEEYNTIRIKAPTGINNLSVDYIRVQTDTDEPDEFRSIAVGQIYESVGLESLVSPDAIAHIYESVGEASLSSSDAYAHIYESVGEASLSSPNATAYVYENIGVVNQTSQDSAGYIYENIGVPNQPSSEDADYVYENVTT